MLSSARATQDNLGQCRVIWGKARLFGAMQGDFGQCVERFGAIQGDVGLFKVI